MSLSFLFKKLLNPDIKKQIEAEYLTSDGKLTDDGERALLQGIYSGDIAGTVTGSDYLSTRADARIADREEARKKSAGLI